MATKIIPFDLETAKKIQTGEIKGKVMDADGKEITRILCTNKRGVFPIVYTVLSAGVEAVVSCQEVDLHIELEVPDDEPQREPKQNFETVAESDAYAEGYRNGFNAGRCVAFDDNKRMALETNEPQFKPFDKVLVRDYSYDTWVATIYSHSNTKGYFCCGCRWSQCIPYEGNEHLVGTTDKPKED